MTEERLQPKCPSCRYRHLPDLPCWVGRYAKQTTARVLARPNGRVCSLQLSRCTGVATTADHSVPRSLGGTDADDNLFPACGPCNSAKGNRRKLPPEPEYPVSGTGLSPRWRS